MAAAAQDLLKSLIASPGVLMLSKTTCPYCARAKTALAGAQIKFNAIEIDTRADGSALQSAALELTGQRTVPNVWVNGTHVGGSDKVVAMLESGQLQKLLGASPL